MAPRPEAPVPYGGPVPPGGWQQPPAPARSDAWEGRPLASWWSRVGAALLDWLILFVPLAILWGSWWRWRSTAAAPWRSWAGRW